MLPTIDWSYTSPVFLSITETRSWQQPAFCGLQPGVVFSLCDQPRSGLALIESFIELFDLEQNSVQTVQTVLTQLSEEGVLVETNDG